MTETEALEEITRTIQMLTGHDVDADSLYLKGIHGVTHACRTLILARKLSALENMSGDESALLAFCAVFHDIGRINDNGDTWHGGASVEKLRANDFFGFSGDRTLAEYMIANHCVPDKAAFQAVERYLAANKERAVYMLKALKDCDNLDRFRIGDFDERYLRLDSSRTLIDTARQLNKSPS